MKNKIIIYKEIDSKVVDYLSQKYEVVYFEQLDEKSYPNFESHLEDANVLMGSGLEINEELLFKCPKLKMVCNVSVGYDNLDLPLLTESNIVATNTPGVLNDTVADAVFGILLATARRIPELDNYVKHGSWRGSVGEELFGFDVHEKVIGIVGMGNIGKAIAKRAHYGFDMKVLYHNRNRNKDAEMLYKASYSRLPELLNEADFVCSMLPFNKTTKNMFSTEEFKLMKNSAIFINGSRGGVVDEDALYYALTNKEIAAAGLDVYKQEPIDPHHSLLNLKNVITLPHIGSATKQTRLNMGMLAANSILKVLEGKVPSNALNKAVEIKQ